MLCHCENHRKRAECDSDHSDTSNILLPLLNELPPVLYRLFWDASKSFPPDLVKSLSAESRRIFTLALCESRIQAIEMEVHIFCNIVLISPSLQQAFPE